jgi:Tfp pilus tip-associated adhesin PilY1
VDYDDDGYFDRIYIGDVNGRLWKVDITLDPSAVPPRGVLSGGKLGYNPFLLYDGWCNTYSSPDVCSSLTSAPIQPIFLQPTAIFLSGGSPPTIGVAFGTGDRANLVQKNANINRFTFVVDAPTLLPSTFHEDNLSAIVPSLIKTYSLTSGCVTTPCAGLRLDYQDPDEKTTSTVLSTLGFLTVITFEPSQGICGTEGSSFRYRFFYLTGQGGYNVGAYNGNYLDFRETLFGGLASTTQSTSPLGDTIDLTLFAGGNIDQSVTKGTVRTDSVNWKENKQ